VARHVPVALALVLLASLPAVAQSQTRAPSAPRLEVGGGAGATGALALGSRDATLLSNDATGTAFRLFASETRVQPAAHVEARLGYRVSPRVTAEGRLTVSRPELRVSLSGDAEQATAIEATSRLTEYVLEGGAVWRLVNDAQRRWVPFVSAGAGVARHVHGGRALVENAAEGYAGGGAIYMFGGPAAVRRNGVRFDLRVQMLSGGLAEGAGVSPRVLASASAFVTF
jgi:hypothetical protein